MNEEQNDNTKTHVVLSQGAMISHYRVINRIGAGGMGEVYLAEDTKLNRKVALKFMSHQHSQSQDLKTRFMREAQAAAKLNHPNIVHIYEVGEYQNRPFFAMENIEGLSLKKHVFQNKYDIVDIIKLAIKICEGLQEAHSAGIVHRDIKPSNIVVDSKGRPRVLDFGLATVTGTEQITKTGSTLGTIGYMSPEQIKGKSVDARADLFSLGVILYELLADRRPFTGESEAEVLNAIQSIDPEPLGRYKSGVPEGLQRITSKLLEKDPGLRYQSAAGVIADLSKEKQLLDSSSSISQPISSIKSGSSKTKLILSGASLVIIVVLLLVLKPWNVTFSPSQEAVASQNLLAIMYFDNLANPSDSLKLGEIAANLLITDLSESQYINVVSSQRLYDILKSLGHEGEKKIGRDVATEVARTANSKWMLLGSILKTNPNIIMTAQIVDMESGNSIASQRIEGQPGIEIFPLIDSLTIEIKNDLALPAAAKDERDLSIADYTSSAEAYKYYLEGMDFYFKFKNIEAVEKFQQAVKIDTAFAMAYFGLSITAADNSTRKQAIANAAIFAERVKDIDKHNILARKAQLNGDILGTIAELTKITEKYPNSKITWQWLGGLYSPFDKEKAIECYERVIEIDPSFKTTYNALAYLYNNSGKVDKSIWAINKYIELAPDEANPYDSRGELYALNGNLDEAIASYEKALEVDPNFVNSIERLANMYMFNGQYNKAESLYQELVSHSDKNQRSEGRLYLSRILLYQGKFKEALKILEIGIEADKMELGENEAVMNKLFVRGVLYGLKLEKYDLAINDLNESIAIQKGISPKAELINHLLAIIARCYAADGNIEMAEKTIELIKNNMIKNDSQDSSNFELAQAWVNFEKGDYKACAKYFKETNDWNFFAGWYQSAVSYYYAGMIGDAVHELEQAINIYDFNRANWPLLSVLVHYWLAKSYEASGWNDKAIEQYEIFLDIWKNADYGIKEVDDAKERLARLKA